MNQPENLSADGYISDRRVQSDKRLDKYKERLLTQPSVVSLKGKITIFATGSYGRREATGLSDIDLFIVGKRGQSVTRQDKYQLFNDLIVINGDLGLKPFSQDCRFLEVHRLSDLLDNLGRPEDDVGNTFTARMLMLLEGRPLTGTSVHDEVVEAVLERYFRDYLLHSDDFLPRFLYNDITRLWKTFCLNYEAYHRPDKDRARIRLENLKLRFARKLTCFSLILGLIHAKPGVSLQRAKELTVLSPVERLQEIRASSRKVGVHVDRAIADYVEFLKLAERTQEVESQIDAKKSTLGELPLSDDGAWNDAKQRSRSFGTSLVDLIQAIGGSEALAQVAL